LTGAAPRAEELPPEDWRAANFTRIQGGNFDANMRVVEFFKEHAGRKGCTSGQIALAWLLHQDTVPIPSTRRVQYLEENTGAASVTLSPAELAEIDRFLAEHPVTG
jgi:aryl-alcohol dehydrogenase-like predicted oxidoreductase